MIVARTPEENRSALADFYESVPLSEIFLQVKQDGFYKKMSYRDICERVGIETVYATATKTCPTLSVETDGSVVINRGYLDFCTSGFSVQKKMEIHDNVIARIKKAGFCSGQPKEMKADLKRKPHRSAHER